MVIPLLRTVPHPPHPRTHQDSDVEEPINKLQNLPAQASSLPGEQRSCTEQNEEPHVFHPDLDFGTIQIWDNDSIKKPLALRMWVSPTFS